MRRLRDRLLEFLRTAGPPRRTAAAFALGVFLSFSPLFGLQIVLGLGAALVFRLSRPVVFAGLCTNLPWFMLPWYTLSTAAGAFILRAPITDVASALPRLLELPLTGPAFWTQALEIATPFFWSLLFGSTAGALLIGVAAYVLTARYLATVCCVPEISDEAA